MAPRIYGASTKKKKYPSCCLPFPIVVVNIFRVSFIVMGFVLFVQQVMIGGGCNAVATTEAASVTTVASITGATTASTTTNTNEANEFSDTIHESSITNDGIIRETVVIPSVDSEREAQELYEKTLQDYNAQEGRTWRKICEPWIKCGCQCTGEIAQASLICRGIGLIEIPLDIPEEIVHLDLGSNNITYLPAKSLEMLQNLEELVLSDNIIERIDRNAFHGLTKLKRLSLQNCGLNVVPSESFKSIPNLISLQLNGNALTHMDDGCLKYLQHLRSLRLEGNRLDRVPSQTLNGLKSLEALNLGNNFLSTVSEGDFPHMHNLVVLLLKRNRIVEMKNGWLNNMTNLKVL